MHKKTLLLVEDEMITALYESKELGNEGYAVIIASSGEEAIRTVDDPEKKIDLILMDIDLGRGMDGTEAARIILSKHDIPVVFLSSHTEREVVDKTEAITSYGYVVKNTGITVLAVSIKMAFKLHEAHRDIRRKSIDLEKANRDLQFTVEELIRHEHALAESESRYRALFEQSTDAIFIAELDTRMLIDCNEKAVMLTGRSREEILKMKADQLHPDEVRQETMQYFQDFITGERTSSVETAVLTREGKSIPVSINASTINLGGKSSLMGIFRDIAEQKRAVEDLRTTEAMYQDLVDNQSAGIYRIRVKKSKAWSSPDEPPYIYEFMNDRYCELTGATREEHFADPTLTLRLIHPDDYYGWAAANEHANNTLAPFFWEGRIIIKEKTRWLHFESRPRQLPDGDLLWTGFLIDITEWMDAANALLSTSEKLRRAQEIAHLTSWTYDIASGTFTETEGVMMAESLGKKNYTMDELINTIHPEDRVMITEAWNEALAGAPFEIEHRIIVDGTTKWIHVKAIPDTDSQGRLTRITGIMQDITERKLMEEKVGTHIKFLESLDLIERGIRSAEDMDGMINNILEVVLTIFASDRAWLLHPCNPDAPVFHVRKIRTRPEYTVSLEPDTDLTVTAETADAFKTALAMDTPLVFDHETGRPIPLGASFGIRSQIIQAIRPTRGEPWLFGMHQCSHARVWTIDDQHLFSAITHRVTDGVNSMLYMESLRESEERLRTLINAMPDIVCFKDGAGRWLEANDFDLRLFELEGVDYRGKKDSDLAVHSDFYREAFLACKDVDEQAWKAGAVSRGDETIPRPDGTSMVFDIIKVPTFTPEGNRKGLIVVGRDITDRKRVEEALERRIIEEKAMREQLEKTSQEKSVLLTELQHRVKNSLAMIASILSLEMGRLTEERSRVIFSNAIDRVRTMSLIYEQLYRSPGIDRIDLNRYVDTVARQLLEAYAAGAGDIRLILRLDQVEIDLKRAIPLGLILNELVINALKYAYPRDAGGEITVSLKNENRIASLSVSDNGIGIPAGSQGMGLQLVSLLAQQIQGEFSIRGDGGTTARVSFGI